MSQEREKHEIWVSRIQMYERSGLTLPTFCKEHHLSAPTFRYHYRKYLAKVQPQKTAQSGFVEVTLPLGMTQDFSLHFSNGIKVCVPEYIDSKYMLKLIEVLRTC